jgi:D-alanine transaminase
MAAPAPLAFLDGAFLPLVDARISPLDRGFLFGDAVYEVVPVFDSRAYRCTEHFDRLDRSLALLGIPAPLSRAEWLAVCGRLVHGNGGGDFALYAQVSRGAEYGRNHVPPPGLKPTVFAFVTPLAPRLSPDPGVDCVTSADIRWHRCDIKSTNLLANVLLRRDAVERGGIEAILLRDGTVREGSYSSVHVVRDGRLLTPPLDHELLPGTTREVVLELAARAGIPSGIRPIRVDELARADEVLLGAATLLVRPVVRIDGRPVGDGRPGPVYRRIAALIDATRTELSTPLPG